MLLWGSLKMLTSAKNVCQQKNDDIISHLPARSGVSGMLTGFSKINVSWGPKKIVRNDVIVFWNFDYIKFLDILNFLAPGMNYEKWCNSFECELKKLVFSYKWLTSYEKLMSWRTCSTWTLLQQSKWEKHAVFWRVWRVVCRVSQAEMCNDDWQVTGV